ncbi:MAG: hypothetical protein HYR67_17745 [Bacteroidetes bacterium]|nr:hypothetical protein [Bacteroidota bacterium]
MKTKAILLITSLIAGAFSCKDESAVVDPVYEFVSFKGSESVNLSEYQNSSNAYPLVAQLLAFEPHTQDIDLTLEVTTVNAQENVDFIFTPHDALKIHAGKLISDTLWIKTIDNSVSNGERRFDIRIKAVNKAEIKIGLGITEPKNGSITFKILDDECSKTISIFNTPGLINDIDWDGDDKTDAKKTVAGVVSGNQIKVTGNLIDYAPFSGASLTLTLTPSSPGAPKGAATFGDQETGTDNDGYAYKFIEVGKGSYDVCSGTIRTTYDIYYQDGGWVYWYTVTNVFATP